MEKATETTEATTAVEVQFNNAIMRIAERKGGKAIFKKFLPYGLPTLDQVFSPLPAPDSWKEEEVKEEIEGEEDQSAIIRTPIYKDSTLEYLQAALTQRVQGLARSRDGAGQVPCMNWQEVEESGSGTKYPIQLRDFKADFSIWLEKATELTVKQQAAVLAFTDAKRLTLADDHRKERVAEFLNGFVASLGEKASDVMSVINTLNKALVTEVEDIDF